jgi:catalase-peroxidase
MSVERERRGAKYSYPHTTLGGNMLRVWWPEELNLRILYQNPPTLVPTDPGKFEVKREFEKNLNGIVKVMRHD